MTTRQLFTLSMLPLYRSMRRWWINRQIKHIGYHLSHIRQQRENDRHVERVLMGKQAVLLSDLRQL